MLQRPLQLQLSMKYKSEVSMEINLIHTDESEQKIDIADKIINKSSIHFIQQAVNCHSVEICR